jgi:hypothetical protein
MIKSYDVVEAGKAELIGKTLQETEEKTTKILNEAILRGCLFVIKDFERIYNEESYGAEVVKLVVCASQGYSDRVSCVLVGNPEGIVPAVKNAGRDFESLFTNFLFFENPKPEDLVKIFESNFCGTRYQLNHEVRQILKKGFMHLIDAYPDFEYTREARRIFEKAVKKQTSRLSSQKNDYSKEKLMQINDQDIEKALQEYLRERENLGTMSNEQ